MTRNQRTSAVRELGGIPDELATLSTMTVEDLSQKYRELFGEPARSRNRSYLRKRLAWRIQEQAEGGLSASALERIAQLGDELPEHWRMRQAAVHATATSPAASGPRDPRLPPAGAVLRRIFNGVEHAVTVCPDGFDYEGTRFRTLSAVAKHITGTPWNGFAFFGLNALPAQNASRR